MVSMKDIAAACGVSVATVSKALNNHSDIGAETRKRVRNAAKELGYHPNLSARALKTNKSYNLGVLYKEESGSGLTHDYFSQVLENFKNTAEHEGYDITFLSNSKSRKDRMSYLEHTIYRGMDGVMIAIADYKDPEVSELLRSDLPVVIVDYVFNGRISILSNNILGMEMLLSYIYEQGHRDIAYIYGEESMVTTNRVSAYCKFLEEKRIAVRDEFLQKGRYRDPYTAGVITAKLLAMRNPPSCIVYADDFSAIGGMNVIKNKGLQIPKDISIAGFDGIMMASQLEPKLTTYRQDTVGIGRLAAEKLISLIENPRATPISHYVMDGELIKGGSVAEIKRISG
ncbi:MAG: LacI family DNA-binding transcriptional regulator [Lachnospiraceae bacterium]|nr:LacI family DNA-binding transcriptional regulator [Lachnospiraceae bacterium]MBO5146531.1 LacI family DNA-binding transcriptional regulator [Lachnospiraceae bacterium]